MVEPPVLFLAFANDRDERARHLRNLAEEARQLQGSLRRAEKSRLCEVVVRQNASVDDILAVLHDPALERRIALFHFGGHAGGSLLLFETADGRPAPVTSARLTEVLRKRQPGLRLVFLNGCSTQGQAQGLLDAGIAAVVATSQAIDDRVATDFAGHFYASFAAGATLEGAYDRATDAVLLPVGDQLRQLLVEDAQDAPAAERLPWDLYVRRGAEVARTWSLPEAAHRPLALLPPLPDDIGLPPAPFRYLNYYRRDDARVFFGRGREIHDLYQRIVSPAGESIVLFSGQSGVGKSSLLAAGLQPRLEASHEVRYARRDQALGLVDTLLAALGSTGPDAAHVGLGSAWHDAEAQCERPVIVILDQAEEAFTRPMMDGADSELHVLIEGLQGLFTDRQHRPQGKLVLSFRKEWLLEIRKRVEDAQLPVSHVFLERLGRDGILEAIEGPASSVAHRQKYGLTVAPACHQVVAPAAVEDAAADLLGVHFTLVVEHPEAQEGHTKVLADALDTEQEGHIGLRPIGLG